MRISVVLDEGQKGDEKRRKMNETKLDLDKVNPVDISILKNEFKKKITENIDGQVLVLDSKGQESDKKRQKMNENLTTSLENFQCNFVLFVTR